MQIETNTQNAQHGNKTNTKESEILVQVASLAGGHAAAAGRRLIQGDNGLL